MTETNGNDAAQLGWIRQAQRGDDGAFAHLVARYQRPVFNLCYRMLGNARDAEDAAQETFLRAYRSIRRFDERRKFSTWLLSIASHYCIDQLRRRRLLTVSMDGLPYLDLEDPGLNPEGELTLKEHQDQIRSLLEHLSPQDRAAVVLRYWHELSYQEIAESLSLTESAVKSRLHRARRELAHRWSESASLTPVEAEVAV